MGNHNIFKPWLFGSFLLPIGIMDSFLNLSSYPAIFSEWAAQGLCLGSIVTCLLILIKEHRSQSSSKRVLVYLAIWLHVLLLCIASVVLLMQSQSEWTPALELAFGAVAGIGVTGMAFIWITAYACLDDVGILLHICASIAIAALLIYVTSFLEIPQILLVAMSPILSAFMLTVSFRVYSIDVRDADTNKHYELSSQRIKPMVKMLWIPLLGTALIAFIIGLTYNGTASGKATQTYLQGLYYLLGLLIALIALTMFSAYASKKKGLYSKTSTLLLPIVTAIIMISPAISLTEGIAASILDVIQHTSFAVIMIIAFYSMAATSRATHAPLLAVCSISFIVLLISTLAGMTLIHTIGEHGRNLCLILLAGYLVAIGVSHALEVEHAKRNYAKEICRPDQFMHQLCKDFEKEFDITPRESEVLFYLGRGYSPIYIAQKLAVSESTIRTHVRHIYSKLGVNSKEELLIFIDSSAQ